MELMMRHPVVLALLAALQFGSATPISRGEGAAGIPAGSLVLLACLCWGFDNHLTALIDGLTPEESTFWKGLVAGIANLLIGAATQPAAPAAPVFLGALVLGALAYGLSIVLYISAAQRLGATRAQLLFASAPFFGVAGSLLLLFRDRHGHTHEHAETIHEHWHRHDD